MTLPVVLVLSLCPIPTSHADPGWKPIGSAVEKQEEADKAVQMQAKAEKKAEEARLKARAERDGHLGRLEKIFVGLDELKRRSYVRMALDAARMSNDALKSREPYVSVPTKASISIRSMALGLSFLLDGKVT